MSNGTIEWLQDWFVGQCNGDWEHQNGIRIFTLDNPGWGIDIDLTGTDLEEHGFSDLRRDVDESNWVICRVRDSVFHGDGGPRNLIDILQVFRRWAEGLRQ